ncbi:MAG: HD domain-containing protein [Mariniphaga sp.]
MVPRELIDSLRIAYKEFIISFKHAPYNVDPAVERTIIHTEKVVENSLSLADSLELNENDRAVAEISALFHDIGRLWILLPENSEIIISDHAQASIEYLKACVPFNQLEEPTRSIIIQVIKNHNKPDLPSKDNETNLFYIKLLRDADKLDVWRATSDYISRRSGKPNLAKDLALSEKPVVTPSFCKIIIEGGIPNKNDLVTFNDFIIFQMSWIFDLHFKKSFQIVNQKQYIRHLYDSLPKNDNVIEIYRMIRIYMENKI